MDVDAREAGDIKGFAAEDLAEGDCDYEVGRERFEFFGDFFDAAGLEDGDTFFEGELFYGRGDYYVPPALRLVRLGDDGGNVYAVGVELLEADEGEFRGSHEYDFHFVS